MRQLLLASVRRYWPVALATLVLVPHALMFDFVNDDAYISFRYARNLSEYGQLVFNLGERVEGFTNFLWTILLAGGIHLGWSPVHLSRFLGVAFGIGVLAVLVRMSLRLDDERPSPWHAVAPLGLAATGRLRLLVHGRPGDAAVHAAGAAGLRPHAGRGAAAAGLHQRRVLRPGGHDPARGDLPVRPHRPVPGCCATCTWSGAGARSGTRPASSSPSRPCSSPTTSGAGRISAGRSPTPST